MRRQHDQVVVNKTPTHEELQEVKDHVVVEQQNFNQLQEDTAKLVEIKDNNQKAIDKQLIFLAKVKQETEDFLNGKKLKVEELNNLQSKIVKKIKEVSDLKDKTITAYRMEQVDHSRILDGIKTDVASLKKEQENLVKINSDKEVLIQELDKTLEAAKLKLDEVNKSIEISNSEFVQASNRLSEINEKIKVSQSNLLLVQKDLQAVKDQVAALVDQQKELQEKLSSIQKEIENNVAKNNAVLTEIEANSLKLVNLSKREIDVDKKARRVIELYAKAGVIVEV